MTEKTQQLDVSAQELEVIANALETQSKILRMQASAGGQEAVARLNEVKRALASIDAQRDASHSARRCEGSWSGFLRLMGNAT